MPRSPCRDEWIDGQPNPLNPAVRLRFLTLVEQAFRRGEQPRLPIVIAKALAREIERGYE